MGEGSGPEKQARRRGEEEQGEGDEEEEEEERETGKWPLGWATRPEGARGEGGGRKEGEGGQELLLQPESQRRCRRPSGRQEAAHHELRAQEHRRQQSRHRC